MTVSEYIRRAIAELTVRDSRVANRRRSLAALAKLPVPDNPDEERNEMWGIGLRVPR